MANFTIYNCGTGYTRARNDVVAKLFNATVSDKIITDGVGTTHVRGVKPGEEHSLGEVGSGWLRGNLFGKGLHANVEQMVEAVKDRLSRDPNLTIDMCGWSRGAVTCFKIANALYHMNDQFGQGPVISQLPIRIFAIDPVPGSAGRANHHMWEDIELTSNIKSYQVVIAQHETRRTFAPILPTLRGGLGDHHVIVMPGNHSGIVEPMGRFDEPSAIVGDLAKRFLRSGKYRRFGDSKKEPQGGTKFLDSSLFGRAETLQLYTKIRQNFGEIRDEAKSSYGSQFSAKRAIRAQNSAGTAHATVPKLSRKLVRYFVNTHHEDVMSSYLPIICQTIKSNAVYEMLRRMTQADFQNDVRKLTLDPSMRGVLSDIHAHFYEMTGCDILP